MSASRDDKAVTTLACYVGQAEHDYGERAKENYSRTIDEGEKPGSTTYLCALFDVLEADGHDVADARGALSAILGKRAANAH